MKKKSNANGLPNEELVFLTYAGIGRQAGTGIV